ncbi:MAG: 3-hydroxy-5-phosphonooxypentane-2,4-dione thiolase [Candidatus Altiarchaeota archaeon]|nr:3-hydroxy-5-phosphonooxypentane-2,4-dione thiolase [Candidatus Altiarchaeota archaeon]
MDWGKKNRMSRIIKPKTGRTVMLAVDHGYFLGPTTGLEDARAAIEPLLPYADCLMPTRGVLRNSVMAEIETPIVLRVSGGYSIIGQDFTKETITTSVEDAIRLNAAGVAFSIHVGGKYEADTLKDFADLVDEAERYGIPALAVTAVGKDMVRDARYLGLACRIGAELGASFVKTYYCENFREVVEGCPVPCVIAGGKKIPEKEALELAYNAISEGAVGVDMGRNIFQSEDPVAMIKAVRAVVHEDATPDEALKLFNSLKSKTAKPKKVTANQGEQDSAKV